MRGFSFWYPEQPNDSPPQPYPFTLDITLEDSIVENVELLNSYNGIYAHAPRFYIARVTGQPTNVGVRVDNMHDIGRIENVHFNPWVRERLTQERACNRQRILSPPASPPHPLTTALYTAV